MHLGCKPWLLGCTRGEGVGAQGRFVRKQIHARTAMPSPHVRTPVEANGGYSERYCGKWWAKGCMKGPDAAETQCAYKHSAPDACSRIPASSSGYPEARRYASCSSSPRPHHLSAQFHRHVAYTGSGILPWQAQVVLCRAVVAGLDRGG